MTRSSGCVRRPPPAESSRPGCDPPSFFVDDRNDDDNVARSMEPEDGFSISNASARRGFPPLLSSSPSSSTAMRRRDTTALSKNVVHVIVVAAIPVARCLVPPPTGTAASSASSLGGWGLGPGRGPSLEQDTSVELEWEDRLAVPLTLIQSPTRYIMTVVPILVVPRTHVPYNPRVAPTVWYLEPCSARMGHQC